VQAQSSRTAQEKFMKRYPTAQIHNVEDITQQMSETGVAEGGFFDPDRPNIGNVVKHKHSGAMGRVKKIGTQGDTTTVYFKDAKTGAMNYGEWKKHVFPIKKQGVAEGGVGGGVRQWANQVRKDHGADVKFRNRQEGSGAVDSIIAKNSQGDTVGVFNRKTNYPTVFEPKTGVAEGSFGSGYGSVFTLYVNTGEKPPTKTKTKKFKREDDAVAWAEDYADTHDQYPDLKMEIKDENGGVVWELEESQGVAEETGDKPFDNMMKKVTKTPTVKARNTERILQKKQREEETRDRLKGGFGPSPADKLSIRKSSL
jgi:hypothetical protein